MRRSGALILTFSPGEKELPLLVGEGRGEGNLDSCDQFEGMK